MADNVTFNQILDSVDIVVRSTGSLRSLAKAFQRTGNSQVAAELQTLADAQQLAATSIRETFLAREREHGKAHRYSK